MSQNVGLFPSGYLGIGYLLSKSLGMGCVPSRSLWGGGIPNGSPAYDGDTNEAVEWTFCNLFVETLLVLFGVVLHNGHCNICGTTAISGQCFENGANLAIEWHVPPVLTQRACDHLGMGRHGGALQGG